MAGELFKRFEIPVMPGSEIDTTQLMNKRVSFITMRGNRYIEVQRKSLKPAGVQ
jgi:hypothetical protein